MICRLTLNGTTSQQYIELSVKYNDFGTHWEAVHSRGNILWNKGEGRSALYRLPHPQRCVLVNLIFLPAAAVFIKYHTPLLICDR